MKRVVGDAVIDGHGAATTELTVNSLLKRRIVTSKESHMKRIHLLPGCGEEPNRGEKFTIVFLLWNHYCRLGTMLLLVVGPSHESLVCRGGVIFCLGYIYIYFTKIALFFV